MINGVINVYKEAGYTSFDVVAKLRGILKQKKIGHTGTLDPMAEGVLIVCLGNGTKLVDMITAGDKEYRAVMKLGVETDTEDITGQILSENSIDGIDEEHLMEVIKDFVGEYNQIPPMYSAIKKDGKKLYEYARAGIDIEREARLVKIFSIDNIEINLPDVSFDVHCSKGTYIRSLCRDIGQKMGCGATLKSLLRSEVHGFHLENALKLSEIEALRDQGELLKHILPVDALLSKYPILTIKNTQQKYLSNGNKLSVSSFKSKADAEKIINETPDELIRVYDDNEFKALYTYVKQDNTFKPYKMFM
ncbi:MAG: tRNA pseudouridine(55) synthase TruB [Lachnospiraceae bacterium]|nr:tRNA pseudouridine(55) synthase TruB [Lachnospiraceae bacterium]